MNLNKLIFAFSVAALSSCSSSYKSGQTPDDVYYSPARTVVAKQDVEEKNNEARMVRNKYQDRQIVMGIYDPRWRSFDDDYDSYYDPYRYGYNCGYYYNPYYYPFPVYISGSVFTNPKNTTPRMTNLGSYNYSNMVVVNQKNGSTRLIRSTRPYNNNNSSNDYIRRIITPTANTNPTNNRYRTPENNTRTYTPSTNTNTNSSSGSSNNGSSGAPVARPRRGG